MLALLAAAEAAMVTRNVCALIDEDFDDEAPHADWMQYNAVRPLRGIRMNITQQGGGLIFDGFADWNGANPGCVTLQLDNQLGYDIEVLAWVTVQGRTATITTGTSLISQTFVGYRPYWGDADLVVDWGPGWWEMAVVGWMLSRHPMSLPLGHNVPFKLLGSCCNARVEPQHGIQVDFIGAGTSVRRFTVAHEIGHYIAGIADEVKNPLFDLDAPFDGCNGGLLPEVKNHHPYQKEYASTAATEGWATFIAAWAFNSQTQSDCVLARPPDHYDFDLDGVSDLVAPYNERSCEDEPWDINSNGYPDGTEVASSPWVPPYAWLDAAINAPFPLNNCQGPLANRGVTSDWTRFWWDMYTDENLSLTKLIQVYDLMDPHTWDKNGFTSTTSDDPAARLYWAAVGAGVAGPYLDQKHNGVDQ
ncbi:MAG: hypothetical protein H6736_20225 [Alphaproteobacteria bacterium]|nr:hypothetical protein [Alphaproteobacteria bacterium]